MQTLGELIKKQREKLGISQRELSRQTGVDNNTIAKLEKGMRKKPNTLALKKIAYILKIDLKKILKLAGYSPDDIDYECSLTTNNITMKSQYGGPILYEEEAVDHFRDIRCAGQAILYLIDNFDFDSLEYNTDNADEMKEAVKRGIPIVRESVENMLDVSNMEVTEVKKKENLKEKEKEQMEISKIKKALIEQKNMNLSGNLYHKTQIDFAYNTNHMEGSTITPDETASIYDTGTILTSSDKVIVLKDATETKNHFTLFKYMLDTIEEKLSEDMIKKFHFILKDGTLTDSEKEWFNVGDYKKRKNFVGNITTTLPKDVEKEMKELLNWYDSLSEKKIEDIIEFHVRFEHIHPFQDGNGRVGRMIMFRECLYNDIMPFFIEERNKDFYLRGIKEYQTNNEKGYLIDTCLNSQDNYEKLVNYFLEEDNN